MDTRYLQTDKVFCEESTLWKLVVFTEFNSAHNPISNRSLILAISRNEKDGKFHNIIQPNLYVSTTLLSFLPQLSLSFHQGLKFIFQVRVYPNGDVLYSIRVTRQRQTHLFCFFSLSKNRTLAFLHHLHLQLLFNKKSFFHHCICTIHVKRAKLRYQEERLNCGRAL